MGVSLLLSYTIRYNIASTMPMGTTFGADGLEPLHPTINTPNQCDRDTPMLPNLVWTGLDKQTEHFHPRLLGASYYAT